MEQGKQSFINEKKYGCKDWYEWNNRNWGTKWDAGEASIDDGCEGEVDINSPGTLNRIRELYNPIK